MTTTSARPDAMTFSIDEWFVVTLARTIKDREGGLALLMDARGVRPLEGGATGKRGKG